jgi:hypothetical protein
LAKWLYLEILSFRTLSIVLVLKNKLSKTRRFGNWICFRPQVREKPILLGPLERASPNHWTSENSIFLKVIHHRQNPIVTTWLYLGESLALRPGRSTPGDVAPGTHWVRGWVDPSAGLGDVDKRKYLTTPGLELRLPQSSSP